jgi:hypothetical protein
MSQEFTQDAARGGNTTTSFTTGQICPETSLYKSTDGKIEFVEYIEAQTAFPPFPGGNGTKKGTWTRLSLASDGGKTGFTSVKVVAGTL